MPCRLTRQSRFPRVTGLAAGHEDGDGAAPAGLLPAPAAASGSDRELLSRLVAEADPGPAHVVVARDARTVLPCSPRPPTRSRLPEGGRGNGRSGGSDYRAPGPIANARVKNARAAAWHFCSEIAGEIATSGG
jgi:hypothetical protein